MLGADGVETVAQVVDVTGEEAALLDEVDEHHAVEHQRSVPFTVSQFLDTLNEAKKVLMLVLETVVKAFGDLFDVEGSEHVSGDVYDARGRPHLRA